MKLIPSLVFPWFVYFILAVGGVILLGVEYPHLQERYYDASLIALASGAILCWMSNLNSLGRVGIWMSEHVPESLRYGSGHWIFRALKALGFAAGIWYVGQLPFMPLIWQAAVIPIVFTACLFIVVWSLVGPIIKLSSNLAWNRAFSFILSLPVFAAIPLIALLVGETFVSAYVAGSPELIFTADRQAETPAGPEDSASENTEGHNQGVQAQDLKEEDVRARLASGNPELRAQAFREIVELSDSCSDYTRDIQAALDPKGHKDVVYRAVQAVGCSDLRTVIGLPRLVEIMANHPDAKTRAAAILAMRKYGDENLRQLAYLLIRRLSANEPPEVIDATAAVLAPLGPDQQRWSVNRLKPLLDDAGASEAAANALIRYFGRVDLVAEYVAASLGDPELSPQAISMVCLLPEDKRSVAEPHVAKIVANIKTAAHTDPGLKALDCLGRVGFEAIRAEVHNPQALARPIAARALAELDFAEVSEVIEVADSCSRDSSEEVRGWCSQSLGQIGAAALPKIMDLLNSGDSSLKSAGKNALQFFDDRSAQEDLRRIREENSGWMANNRRLEIAHAINTALVKIERQQESDSLSSAPTAGDAP